MVKIFCLELNNEIEEKTFDFLLSFCSEDKKYQILKKKVKIDRDRSVVGNALAKYAIKKMFSVPVTKQKFCYTENGKPYLPGYKNIHFSVSHSGKFVVCAASDKPVGIDIQKKRGYSDKLAKLLKAENSDEFFDLWTKKEAVIKKDGIGVLLKNLKELDVSGAETFIYNDYYISIAN